MTDCRRPTTSLQQQGWTLDGQMEGWAWLTPGYGLEARSVIGIGIQAKTECIDVLASKNKICQGYCMNIVYFMCQWYETILFCC